MYNIGNQGKIMRKLLGKPAVESSHEPSNLGITSSPIVQSYRPSASQNTVFHTGAPIACLDKSPDGRSVILAGPHILRTVKFDGLTLTEGVDLRAIISARPVNKSSAVASTSDQLSVKDVKWAGGRGDATIFTACANGKIFQYDLTRLGADPSTGRGLDFIQIREDSRQVNTLDINPHRGSYLLSGSQDGVVRCFDIRAPVSGRSGPTFRAVQGFKCNADGVRHVKWSPKDGFYFACATEQGVVLKWDIRKASGPILRINAHDKACAAISWHPDGDHLISAGWDNRCHVWDVSRTADKRQKPKYTISTPAPVADIAWRPGLWSASAQGKRAAQVAVSYDESSQKRYGINAVHIWDLARPTMPFKEIEIFESSPSALLWHDQDLLWTAGQDGIFAQCDVAYAPKVIDRTTMSTMTFSARGDVLMFLDERTPPQRPRGPVVPAEVVPSAEHSYGSSPTTPMLSISRSDSEDDVVGSFLGPRKRVSRKRRASVRTTNALSTTPPSGPDEPVLSLEQGIRMAGQFRAQQAMALGPVPSAADVNVYQYLAANYLGILETELPNVSGGLSLNDRAARIMETYAQAAETVSQFRLAQTWRILAYAADLLLRRRAQYHLEARLKRIKDASNKAKKRNEPTAARVQVSVINPSAGPEGEQTPRKISASTNLAEKQPHHRSLLAEEFETTSDVPTPVARPVDDSAVVDSHPSAVGFSEGKRFTPVFEPDDFSLPPAAHPVSLDKRRRRIDSIPPSEASRDSDNTHMSSTEGYDFYDMETIAHAIDVPRPKNQQTPVLDYVAPRSPDSQRKPVNRHNPEDGFAQIFSISEGSRQSSGLTSSSGNSIRRISTIQSVAEHPDEVAGDASEGEYGSRIRGQEMRDSPEPSQHPFIPRRLDRTETTMTETTDEYLMPTQTTDDSVDYISTTAVSKNNNVVYTQQNPSATSFEAIETAIDEMSPHIIESDYLPWPDDPPYPHPLESEKAESAKERIISPLNPYKLISRALAFETRSSALNASAMVLLLKPLMPENVIDSLQAAAILRQHHSRLMGMKHFIEATLLRKLCLKGWPGDIMSDWGEDYSSIFCQAQQGVNTGFFCSQCRKPREVDRITDGDRAVWKCERCRAVMGPCAVCGHRDRAAAVSPDDEPVLSTWWYCPGCGHGGHSTCIEGWHSAMNDGESLNSIGDPGGQDAQFSDGCCPLDGCGHACLPGRWRSESIIARTEEVSRLVREAALRSKSLSTLVAAAAQSDVGMSGSGGPSLGHSAQDGNRIPSGEFAYGVRGDGNEVPQSRAVDSVREVLAIGGIGISGSGGSGTVSRGKSSLSSSPARDGLLNGRGSERERERERRKSVKFARAE